MPCSLIITITVIDTIQGNRETRIRMELGVRKRLKHRVTWQRESDRAENNSTQHMKYSGVF